MKFNENNSSLRISAGMASQFPKDNIPHIVFSGRSNVGKSSLINTLLNRKKLARVSGEPGKTITVNFYDIDKKMFFVDLPGYGFAKRAPADKAKWSALTNGYLTNDDTHGKIALVLQLIDMKAGITADDRIMLDWLCETETPFIVVATKCDKLNKTEKNASLEKIKNTLTDEFRIKEPSVVPFSSLKGEGKEEVMSYVLKYCNNER